MILSITYLLIYIAFLGPVLIAGLYVQRRREEQRVINPVNLNKVTVIIPFRNEEKRIMPLLLSLNRQVEIPAEVFFIDDHSTDQGVSLIQRELNDLPYKILQLVDKEGKKAAIEYAIQFVKTEYVLTLDADVSLPDSYFKQLGSCEQVDMMVLPVAMRAQNFWQRFFEMDLLLATGVNAGLAGLFRPIMASGANLLYKKDCFEKLGGFVSNRQYASGDDTFLLRSFTKARLEVSLLTDPLLAVRTDTPTSFSEYLKQRLRWLGKTTALKDSLNTFTALVQGVLSVAFIIILVYFIQTGNFADVLLIYLMKVVGDLGLFFYWFKRSNRFSSWWLLPIYELYFPVLSLLMLCLIPFYKTDWKGRPLHSGKTSKRTFR